MPRKLNLWDYADFTHPFYTTQPQTVGQPIDRAPAPGTLRRDLMETPGGGLREPLLLGVQGMPSAAIWQKDGSGNTIMSIRRNSRFMQQIQEGDLSVIRQTAQRMFDWLSGMSVGPYTLKLLKKMGHQSGPGGPLPRRYKGLVVGNVSRYRTA